MRVVDSLRPVICVVPKFASTESAWMHAIGSNPTFRVPAGFALSRVTWAKRLMLLSASVRRLGWLCQARRNSLPGVPLASSRSRDGRPGEQHRAFGNFAIDLRCGLNEAVPTHGMGTIESLVWRTSTIFHALRIPHVGSFLPPSMRSANSLAKGSTSPVSDRRAPVTASSWAIISASSTNLTFGRPNDRSADESATKARTVIPVREGMNTQDVDIQGARGSRAVHELRRRRSR